MPRARNLKPSFFTSEQLAKCSDGARLLFAGLWTLADREGRLENRPLKIKAEVFPYEDRNIPSLLGELRGADLIKTYRAAELDCIWIPSFLKHQNPHKNEKPSDLPPYDDSRNYASTPAESISISISGIRNPECPPRAGANETGPAKRDLLDEAQCPPELATPQVRDAIREFNEHRREHRWGAMSARSWSKVWKSFTGFTPSDFVAAVDASIAAGWRGIFPPNGATHGARPARVLNGDGQTHAADRKRGFGEF